MIPVFFKSYNYIFGIGQKQYKQLPAYKNDDGNVVTCWKLTWKERFKIFFSGRMYIQQLTFNTLIQPILPSIETPLEFEDEKSYSWMIWFLIILLIAMIYVVIKFY